MSSIPLDGVLVAAGQHMCPEFCNCLQPTLAAAPGQLAQLDAHVNSKFTYTSWTVVVDVPSLKLEHQSLQALGLLPARLAWSYKPHAMSRTGHAKV